MLMLVGTVPTGHISSAVPRGFDWALMAGRGGRSCPGQGDDTEGSRQTERKHSDTDKVIEKVKTIRHRGTFESLNIRSLIWRSSHPFFFKVSKPTGQADGLSARGCWQHAGFPSTFASFLDDLDPPEGAGSVEKREQESPAGTQTWGKFDSPGELSLLTQGVVVNNKSKIVTLTTISRRYNPSPATWQIWQQQSVNRWTQCKSIDVLFFFSKLDKISTVKSNILKNEEKIEKMVLSIGLTHQ